MTCCRPTKRWIVKLDQKLLRHPTEIQTLFNTYLDLFRDERSDELSDECSDETNNDKPKVCAINTPSITLPSVQKRLLLEELINQPSASISSWFIQAKLQTSHLEDIKLKTGLFKTISSNENNANMTIPKRFIALINEITDNYLNSNN